MAMATRLRRQVRDCRRMVGYSGPHRCGQPDQHPGRRAAGSRLSLRPYEGRARPYEGRAPTSSHEPTVRRAPTRACLHLKLRAGPGARPGPLRNPPAADVPRQCSRADHCDCRRPHSASAHRSLPVSASALGRARTVYHQQVRHRRWTGGRLGPRAVTRSISRRLRLDGLLDPDHPPRARTTPGKVASLHELCLCLLAYTIVTARYLSSPVH
jgi:hypothetical protein